MLDITRQCDTHSRHNVTAMSECVVAESEARADVLQNWARYSDAAADRCIKLSRKSKRYPYGALDRCLSAELGKVPVSVPVDNAKK